MFRAAVIRLTLWYLALIMGLSIGFSLPLYRLSVNEIINNQQQQRSLLRHSFQLDLQPGFQDFENARETELENSQNRIQDNLIYFNLVILVLGGAISYLLARRTLYPIERALESQRRFTADASHELRTPLTAMKTELEVALRDNSLDLARSRELHKSTLEEIDRLEILSNGLLKLAREDGATAADFKVWPMADIVEEARRRVAPAASQCHIELILAPTDETIEGEHWSLVELFSILLDNAVKYSPSKSTITLSYSSAHHGQRLAVSIQDQGKGILPADLPFIFNRFYRADLSRSTSTVPGYGLGLSIAKLILERHHGDIEVESEPGKGSTFTVSLPLRQHLTWNHRTNRPA